MSWPEQDSILCTVVEGGTSGGRVSVDISGADHDAVAVGLEGGRVGPREDVVGAIYASFVPGVVVLWHEVRIWAKVSVPVA